MRLFSRTHSDDSDQLAVQSVAPARPWMQLTARVGLWSLVALGAFGGLVGLVAAAGSGTASSDPESVGEAVETPAAVPGVAERAVLAWIEADESRDLDGVFAVATQTRSGFSTRWVTRDVATVAVEEMGDRYWAVTVAATVEEHSGGELVAVGEWFVQVGVVETGGDLIAVTEPALVPRPTSVDGVRIAGRPLGTPDRGDPVTDPVAGFLGALLAGDGRVEPYLASGVDIAAVTPLPFVSAVVERQAVDELSPTERRVRVRVRATTPAGSTRHLSYQLVLVERDGRWEIQEVSGAPDIARSAATPTDPAGPTSPSGPTTTVVPDGNGSVSPADTAPTEPPVPSTSPAPTTSIPISSSPGA